MSHLHFLGIHIFYYLLVVAFLLPRLPVVGKFFNIINTLIHELGHALMSLLLHGKVMKIQIFQDTSGVTTTKSDSKFKSTLVSLAGYPFASVMAFVCFFLEAQLLLTDAATGKELLSATQSLRVESNGSVEIDFPVDIPAGTLGVTCRMTVTGKTDGVTYTDGEEKTLPVLSRRQLVTETVPFFITRQGRKTFSLELLRQNSKRLTSCTMQFTPSPLWNAVVALPSLTAETHDCNDYLFNRLYANTLSLHILATHPQLEQLFTDCQNRHPEALQSKLAANEALMQILLNETPWVADAQQEAYNIRAIARLFDEQQAHQKMDYLVRKLTANQNRDGGWPWFAGGTSNIYITENILIGAGRLSSRNININDHFLASSTIQKAIEYVDEEKEKRYQEWKKKWPESLQRYTLSIFNRIFAAQKNKISQNETPHSFTHHLYIQHSNRIFTAYTPADSGTAETDGRAHREIR